MSAFKEEAALLVAEYAGDDVLLDMRLEGELLCMEAPSGSQYTIAMEGASSLSVFSSEGVSTSRSPLRDTLASLRRSLSSRKSKKKKLSEGEDAGSASDLSDLSSGSFSSSEDSSDDEALSLSLSQSQGTMDDMQEFEETPLHPCLLRDIQCLHSLHGPESLTVAHQIHGDQVLDLSVRPAFLSQRTCEAWKVDRFMPVRVRIVVSSASYMAGDCPKPKVEQDRGGLPLGIAGQLASIAGAFLQRHWAAFRGVYMQDASHSSDATLDIVSMGFSLSQARGALQLCKGDRASAIELLLTEPEKCEASPEVDLETFRVEPGAGLLANLYSYLLARFPLLHRRCVICDGKFMWGTPMLKPAICTRPMCAFAFQELGLAADGADGMATQAEVVDLLVCMARAAAESARCRDIFDPFPHVYLPGQEEPALCPDAPNYDLASEVMRSIHMRSITMAHSAADRNKQSSHPLAIPTLSWIISSNRCHLVKLPREQHLQVMGTPRQYIMLSAPPEVEDHFAKMREKHGSAFAFHGSGAENWHAILRNGLRNVSGTKLQLNGAAHGAGIYLSTTASYSLNYSKLNQSTVRGNATDERWIDPARFNCIALCETIKNPELRQSGTIWVQPINGMVLTRFLFVYHDANHVQQASRAVSTDKAFHEAAVAAMEF